MLTDRVFLFSAWEASSWDSNSFSADWAASLDLLSSAEAAAGLLPGDWIAESFNEAKILLAGVN